MATTIVPDQLDRVESAEQDGSFASTATLVADASIPSTNTGGTVILPPTFTPASPLHPVRPSSAVVQFPRHPPPPRHLIPSHPLNTVASHHVVPLQQKEEWRQQQQMIQMQQENQRLEMMNGGSTADSRNANMRTRQRRRASQPIMRDGNTASSATATSFTPPLHPSPPGATAVSSTASSFSPSGSSRIRDGPLYGLSGSSSSAGTYSRSGIALSLSGFRSSYQQEQTAQMEHTRKLSDLQQKRLKEQPFSHQSLTNPWSYVPSLYDAAADDEELTALAIALGIPQPEPMLLQKQIAAEKRKMRGGGGSMEGRRQYEEEEDDENEDGSIRRKRQPTIEEILKKNSTNSDQLEESKEMMDASSSPPPPPPPPPISTSLWQSAISLLPIPPSPPPVPYISKTSLSSLTSFITFSPPVSSPDVPRKYWNRERRRRKGEEKNVMEVEGVKEMLRITSSSEKENGEEKTEEQSNGISEASSTHKPSSTLLPLHPHHSQRPSRPGSASTFGSFIVRQASAAAAAAAAQHVKKKKDQQQQQHAVQQSQQDDESTIFSLTQIGSTERDQPPTTEEKEEQTLILHPTASVSIEESSSEHEIDDPFEKAMTTIQSRPHTARERPASGNRFLEVQQIDSSTVPATIPQRVDSNSDARMRNGMLNLLSAKRSGMTLSDRLAYTTASLHRAHSSSSSTPAHHSHTAQKYILRKARIRSRIRPHRPPSIPSKIRPEYEVSGGYMQQLRKKMMAQAQQQQHQRHPHLHQQQQQRSRPSTGGFRSLGHRSDFQFTTPVQMRSEEYDEDRMRKDVWMDRERRNEKEIVMRKSAVPLSSSFSSPPSSFTQNRSQRKQKSSTTSKSLSHTDALEHAISSFQSQLKEWDQIDVVEEGVRSVYRASPPVDQKKGKQRPHSMYTARKPHPPTSVARPASAVTFQPTKPTYSPSTTSTTGASSVYPTRPVSAYLLPKSPVPAASLQSRVQQPRVRPQSGF